MYIWVYEYVCVCVCVCMGYVFELAYVPVYTQ